MADGNSGARVARVHGLDAIRGLAALSVLLYHALLTVPALDTTSLAAIDSIGWEWVLAHSPLRAGWAGGAAVTLFFVLSGYVLTIAVARSEHHRWSDYYVRRILRLYLPVVGAVVLASFWITLVPRFADDGLSRWMSSVGQPTTAGVIKDLSLFLEPGSTTSVLWSLTWELAFSLLLPLYLWVVTRSARWGALGLLGAIGLSVVGDRLEVNVLRYMPTFAIGCYLAAMPDRSRRFARSVWGDDHSIRRGVTLIALAQMFTLPFLLDGVGLDTPVWLAVGWTSLLLSCGAIVAIAAESSARGTSRRHRAVQWLGSRSFSVYLVHEPIVVSTAIVATDAFSTWLVLPVALPASLTVAEVFYRTVERPVIDLVRRVHVPLPRPQRAVAPASVRVASTSS